MDWACIMEFENRYSYSPDSTLASDLIRIPSLRTRNCVQMDVCFPYYFRCCILPERNCFPFRTRALGYRGSIRRSLTRMQYCL